MYANLHTLPPDQAMYTLYVAQHGDPLELSEEFDQVAANRAPEHTYLTSLVIAAARDTLVASYGPTVDVIGIVDQSAGSVLFDSRVRGFRPIPVVPPARLAESFDRPYDAFISLCQDAHDGLGTTEYLDYLTQEG